MEINRPIDNTARGYATRIFDFTPEPTSLYVQFDFHLVSHNPSIGSGNAIKFYVGSDFSNGVQNPTNGETYARFGINFSPTTPGNFSMNPYPSGGGTVSPLVFSGIHRITFIVNKNSSSLYYRTPLDQLEQQPINTYDLWVGNTKVFDNQAIITSSQRLTDFRIVFDNGVGTVRFDNFLIRDIAGVLPVKLLTFQAKQQGEQVNLSWTTAWEKDASHFVVERSHENLSSFVPIGEVKAKGNTDQRNTYLFVDQRPLAGISYYRLKQVDVDQKTEQSKAVSVTMDYSSPSLDILGNPIQGNVVRFMVRHISEARYRLLSPIGNDIPFQILPQGDGTIQLTPLFSLPAGVYTLQVIGEDAQLSQKLLVQ
ncbi:hypothetical protein GCM10023189_30730 [Nibrella saemangeumensis]|uniref:Por secretion system C-terminal sorting domain-containing protein n=1 Tax=Nibrella saemangeumensis TaxID=1084526 RepID=A0ABP8N370_9BACT